MADAIVSGKPGISSAPRRPTRDALARARAQAVLDELDERYEPGWWRQHWRRQGLALVTLALGAIVVAGAVTAARRGRRHAFRWRR